MPVVHNPESEYMKEVTRWDTPRRNGGFRPDGFEAFPSMLYKAAKTQQGKIACMEAEPSVFGWRDVAEYGRAIEAVATFNRSCQRIVRSESEMLIAKGQGWRESPKEAIAALEEEEQALARAAAEALYAAQRMTELARREFDAADRDTSEHIADVPKKKGWPKGKSRAKADETNAVPA